MSGLDATRLALLKGLFAGVSDDMLQLMDRTFAQGGGGGAVAVSSVVARQVQEERADRAARDAVFAPLAPLSQAGPLDGLDPAAAARLSFNPVPEIWRLLKDCERDAVEAVVGPLAEDPGSKTATARADELLLLAAGRLETDPEWAGVRLQSEAGPARAPGRLALLLRLGPVLREVLPRAREIARAPSPSHAAGLKLAFRDVTSTLPGGAPVLLAALAAHLPRPWQVLRLVCVVMERPTERFLAASELAPFGETVLADIDARIARLAAFRGDTGAEGGAAAGAAVLACVVELSELEAMVALAPDGPWGRSVARQKALLADNVARRLKEAVQATAQALPVYGAKLGGRVRGAPRLDQPFDALAAQRAQGLLAFLDGTRTSAGSGGFGAVRAGVVAELDDRLDAYVDDLLAELHARGGDGETGDLRERLAFAADCLGFVRDPQAAQLVRRRAAAA